MGRSLAGPLELLQGLAGVIQGGEGAVLARLARTVPLLRTDPKCDMENTLPSGLDTKVRLA